MADCIECSRPSDHVFINQIAGHRQLLLSFDSVTIDTSRVEAAVQGSPLRLIG